MSFKHIYNQAAAQAANSRPGNAAVDVESIRRSIIDGEYAVEIVVDAVELDEAVSLGHIKVEDRREDRWQDEMRLHAQIRIHRKLNRCWARFVSCKEMMHIFDGPGEVVDTFEKFRSLLQEIETKPIDQSEMFNSEFRAEWMALLVLCPKDERDRFKARLGRDEISRYDVAWHFRIPEIFVTGLMSDTYDYAYDRLIADLDRQAAADPNDA